MSRQQKNKKLLGEMSSRLKQLIEEYLEMTIVELSKYLGYSNITVLRNMCNGKSFPDTERLVKLAKLKTNNGSKPNIHWLITGEGSPIISKKVSTNNVHNKLKIKIDKLDKYKAKSLLNFLSNK